MSYEVRGKNWTVASSHDYPFPETLRISQTTDLCLAQERVGQLDLGVVRNIKMFASLRQGDVQLFLEMRRVKMSIPSVAEAPNNVKHLKH